MEEKKTKRPKIDPSRQVFSTNDSTAYIDKGNLPDTKGTTSSGRRLIVIILMVLVFVATVFWCIYSFNKYKEEESALSLGNGYYDIHGNWVSLDMPDVDIPDVNLQKNAKTKETKPKQAASDEIKNASILSGMFQVGDTLYTLPLPLSDMLSNGFVLYTSSEWKEKEGQDITDMEFLQTMTHKVILRYGEDTYITVLTYNPEGVTNVLDSTVVAAGQYKNQEYWSDDAEYLYLPGGLHIGMDSESAGYIYDIGDGQLSVTDYKANNNSKQYNYGGREAVMPNTPMNFIQYYVNGEADEVETLSIYKNN